MRSAVRARAASDAEPSATASLVTAATDTWCSPGDYADIRRFIHQLETAPEFVVIEDVALAQGESATRRWSLTWRCRPTIGTGADGT